MRAKTCLNAAQKCLHTQEGEGELEQAAFHLRFLSCRLGAVHMPRKRKGVIME